MVVDNSSPRNAVSAIQSSGPKMTSTTRRRSCVSKCVGVSCVKIAQQPSNQPPLRYVPKTDPANLDLGLRALIGLEDAINRTLKFHRKTR
jgi:hypothetical protein